MLLPTRKEGREGGEGGREGGREERVSEREGGGGRKTFDYTRISVVGWV